MKTSIFGADQDKYFMGKALIEARKAYAKDEVPIGAVIVGPEGTIVARAYNRVESAHTQCAHAEVQAIQKAGKKRGDWRLDGHWLYVTLEPCTMCMGLIFLSRLSGVVYGADSPLFGYRLDKVGTSRVYKKDALVVIKGVGVQESAKLLKHFFQGKRKKGEWYESGFTKN